MMIHIRTVLLLYCVSLILVGFGLHAAVITGQEPIIVKLGNGPFVSYLVFDESTLGPATVVYSYEYTGIDDYPAHMNGLALMNEVASLSQSTEWALSYTTGDFGFITSVTIGGNTSMVVDPYGSPLWTYWIKGGELDAYNYDTGENFTISPLDWVIAPSGGESRRIAPGSYDAWTVSPFNYTGTSADIINFTDTNGNNQAISMGIYTGAEPLSGFSPVPEPSTLPLLILSVVSLFLYLRKRSAPHV